jgi:hypothetical protein
MSIPKNEIAALQAVEITQVKRTAKRPFLHVGIARRRERDQ